MPIWSDVVGEVRRAALELGHQRTRLFYRGQIDADWGLAPSLSRIAGNVTPFDGPLDATGKPLSLAQRIENSLFYQLLARGGHLLPRNPRPWELLFLMRHHGFPT